MSLFGKIAEFGVRSAIPFGFGNRGTTTAPTLPEKAGRGVGGNYVPITPAEDPAQRLYAMAQEKIRARQLAPESLQNQFYGPPQQVPQMNPSRQLAPKDAFEMRLVQEQMF